MPVDMDEIQKEYEEAQARQGNSEKKKATYVKLQNGPNPMRMLPPPASQKVPWRKVRMVFGVGPNKKAICPPNQPGNDVEEDELDREIKRLRSLGDDESKALADHYRGRIRFVMPVHNRAQPDPAVQWYSMAPRVKDDLVSIMVDPGAGDITDPQQGRDIKVHKKPQGDAAAHISIQPAMDRTPLDIDEELYKDRDLFEEYRIGKPSTDEYIRAVLDGKEDEFFEKLKQQNQQSDADVPPPPPPQTDANTEGDQLSEAEKQLAALKEKKQQNRFWVYQDGDTRKKTEEELAELPAETPVIPVGATDDGWKTAADFQ